MLKRAITERNGQRIAALIDDAGESPDGTWLEPLVSALRRNDFAVMAQCTEHLLEQYKDPGNAYLTPVMAKVLYRLPVAAAHDEASLRKCKELLDNIFRTTRAGAEGDRQSLSLLVLVMLFKVFFALDTPALGRNLVRTVSQPGFPSLSEFSLRHQVAFRHFSGRLCVLEDDAASALAAFSLVYAALPSTDLARRRLVYEYLAPVRMSLGYRPDEAVLTELGLHSLSETARAVRAGHGRLLSSLLDKHRRRFYHRGTYLMMCRLKLIASRQLLKASVKALDGTNKVNLRAILPLFEKWDDFDPGEDAMEQLKCVIVNLIFQGLVRGYVSHEHGVLVLSAKEPFPRTGLVLGGVTAASPAPE